MQLHELQRKNSLKTKKRIGRGGKRGKTSGKGHKGQKARAGNSTRPEMRDTIKRIPKRRGYGKNRARTVNAESSKPAVVNVAAIERYFEKGDTVSAETLLAKGLVRRHRGRLPQVKVLGSGTISKSVTISGCLLSPSAQEKVEKAGGSVA